MSAEDMSAESPPPATPMQRQTSLPVLEALLLGLSTQNDNSATRAIAFFDPATRNLLIFRGPWDFDSLIEAKSGPLPASKTSVAAMPRIMVTGEERGQECAVCLEEFRVGGETREMPCKHRFHSGCIEKWLGIHGTCPVCRFLMPVEEQGNEKSPESQQAVWLTLVISSGDGPGSDTSSGHIAAAQGARDGSSSQDV
ncbi:E3 ubiquitin-protein ligase MPSR1-like [Punica granatum]|nr:E3 ubiquitin-protein ligase MPSR1-like [Punica granatum]